MRCIVSIITLVFCVMTTADLYGQNIPTSRLSANIVAQQRPALQKTMSNKRLQWGAPLYIRIFKEEKRLEVWLKCGNNFKLFKSYAICTYGGKGLGPKTRNGDCRAPEGFYFVTPEQLNPYSQFHLAFNLGYPNRYDQYHGRTGSALMVHGDCVSIGCFAMTDKSIEEIYTLAHAALSKGQPFFRVHIFPFKMTDKNMNRYRKSKWIQFWRNLKTGYDWFENHDQVPPDVFVRKGRYQFSISR